MRFEVFAAVNVQMLIFWVHTLCNIEGTNQHFRETCCLHLQGRNVGTRESEVW